MTKKILYVIPSLATGGAELQTINQLNFISEKHPQHSPSLAILGKELANFPLLKISSTNIYTLNKLAKSYVGVEALKNSYSVAKSLAKIIKEKNVDTIISILPISHFICRLMFLFLMIGKKKKLIVYYRAMDYHEFPLNTLVKQLFNKLNSILAFFFDDKAIFISKAVHKDINANFHVPKSHRVIYNSLPVKTVHETLAYEYFRKNNIQLTNKFIVIIPGRLTPSKGHSFFIKSFAKFLIEKSISPNKFLVIVAGGGELHASLKASFKKNNLIPSFHFTNNIKNELMLSLISTSNLVCIPSISEGFGNVAIEALMLGKIVLSSNSGGLDEIIEDQNNGFKFETLNINSFIDKFAYLYDNSDTNLINSEGIKRSFKKKYNITNQVTELLDFI